jgi:Uma2 family endonuclease
LQILVVDELLMKLRNWPAQAMIPANAEGIAREEAGLREKFYHTVEEGKYAEFINGHIIMHLPPMLMHAETLGSVLTLLHSYATKHRLGLVLSKLMVHLSRNSYQPDVLFYKKETARHFKKGQMLFPAPDLVVEVLSPSTEKNDRGIKFEDYALHSVMEYWIVDPVAETIEQYLLSNNSYILEFKGKNGVIISKAITGFSINATAVFNEDDNDKALEELRK